MALSTTHSELFFDESRIPDGKSGSTAGVLFELESTMESRRLLHHIEKLLDALTGPDYRNVAAGVYSVEIPGVGSAALISVRCGKNKP